MLLLHKRAAFRLREHGYREIAPGEIGNLSAGYGAGINLMQFISLSLSGLLILITTQCDSLFEIPRTAGSRPAKRQAGCAAQKRRMKNRARSISLFSIIP